MAGNTYTIYVTTASTCTTTSATVSTVDKNIIAITKIWNNYVTIQSYFPILK